MVRSEKVFDQMRRNPLDWRIEDLQTIALRHGMTWDQPGTSHVTFRSMNGSKLTVPARKPIKPVYVRKFVALIDSLKGEANV